MQRKQLNETSLWTHTFLKTKPVKTIEILVKGTQMQREAKRKYPILIVPELNSDELRMQRMHTYTHCGTQTPNIPVPIILHILCCYHVYSNDLIIELYVRKSFERVFFFLVHSFCVQCIEQITASHFDFSIQTIFVVETSIDYCFACYYL